MAMVIMVLRTDPVTGVPAHMDPVTSGLAMATQAALSRSRLAIGRITIAAQVITWAAPITSGDRDTGYGATVKESGFMATMW